MPEGFRFVHAFVAALYAQVCMAFGGLRSWPMTRCWLCAAKYTSGLSTSGGGDVPGVVSAHVFVATSYSHVSARNAASLNPPNRTITPCPGSYERPADWRKGGFGVVVISVHVLSTKLYSQVLSL